MKMKLIGISLAALSFAVFGATQAKADSTATAAIDITSATLSGNVGGLENGSLTFTNNLTATAAFGAIGSPETEQNASAVTIGGSATNLTPAFTSGNGSFDEVVGSPATNGSEAISTLSGSLLSPGGAASNELSTGTVVNGYYSTGTTTNSKNTSNFTFVAGSSGNITLTIGGSYEAYADIYNTTNVNSTVAAASISYSVTLTDTTANTVQTFNPSILNASVSDQGTNPAAGTNGLTSFGTLSQVFSLTAGDQYTFVINDTTATVNYSVPEPGALGILGSGLVGLGGLLSMRRRKQNAA